MKEIPVLFSFRRCPYAMRARLALASAKVETEHREVLLRDKPAALLGASPKGTVPVVVLPDRVIDESLDIMLWALMLADPEGWLNIPPEGHELIEECDGPFKHHLDRYKYASRDPAVDPVEERQAAASFVRKLDQQLSDKKWLYGETPRLPDMAILTFVRQFAHVDLEWFQAQDWKNVQRWLADFKESDRFKSIMKKHPQWVPSSQPGSVS